MDVNSIRVITKNHHHWKNFITYFEKLEEIWNELLFALLLFGFVRNMVSLCLGIFFVDFETLIYLLKQYLSAFTVDFPLFYLVSYVIINKLLFGQFDLFINLISIRLFST